MKRFNLLKKDERGVASIIIVMLMIMILTLIVLAMARNANREQRQSLDRQLSAQASYAAESGVNDTVEYIRKNLTADESVLPKKKTTCDGVPTLKNISGADTEQSAGQVGDDSTIKYTCILYDREPPTIELANVGSGSATMMPIQNGNATGISSLTISWEDTIASGGGSKFSCGDGSSLPPSSSYGANCEIGMLRLEFINASSESLKRDVLIDNDAVIFAYPGGTDSTPNRGNNRGENSGILSSAICSATGTPYKCKITVTGMDMVGDAQMYLRIKTLYRDGSKVSISGTSADGQPVNFKNGQIVIDSTGKANDVLKRIQVRVPVIPGYETSDYAIKTSGNLCKLVDVYPGYSNDSCSY